MCRFLFQVRHSLHLPSRSILIVNVQKLKNQNSLKWGPDDVESYNPDECHVPPGTDPKSWTSKLPPDIDAPTSTSTSPVASSSSSSRPSSVPAMKPQKPPARPQLSAAANKVPLYTGMKRPSPDSLCDRPMKKPTWVPPPDESCDRLLRRANLPPKPV